jgi:hypothetical protein
MTVLAAQSAATATAGESKGQQQQQQQRPGVEWLVTNCSRSTSRSEASCMLSLKLHMHSARRISVVLHVFCRSGSRNGC